MSYYRSLTVDHTKVATNLPNFSVLVSITDATLKTVASGGHVQRSDGFDINFYSDSAHTTKLKWEMESYDGTAGTVVAWVKIASLSSTIDTVFYMFYGDPSITTDQSDPTNTWDANTQGVWHMSDNAASTTILATKGVNAVNVANTNTKTTTGQIARGLTYNGSSDGSSSAINLSGTDKLTLSFWLKWTTNASDDALAFEYTTNYNGQHAFIVDPNSSTSGGCFEIGMSNAGTYFSDRLTSRPSTGAWHLYHLVFNRDTPLNTVYVDGSSVALTTIDHSMTGSSAFDNSTLYFMSRNKSVLFGDGLLDEVKIVFGERVAEWITTEFNNQNDPGTFITVGTETTVATVLQRRTLSAVGTRIGSRQLQCS